MKALVLHSDNKLQIEEISKPIPSKGEVLLRIKSAALNHRDLWIQKGMYPGLKLPCILGGDGAGVIEQVGDAVSETLIGKEVIIYPAYDWGDDERASSRSFRVLGMPDPGTFAEFISIPQENFVEKPSYLSWAEAAAMPIAGLTAWRALKRHGEVKQGDKILITGIGGGVAQQGLALALTMGAKVFVTSSSTEKINKAISIGASGGANYKEDGWNLKLKELSEGIDMVLDSSPPENLDDYLKFMNYGGRIISYGSTGSLRTSFHISKFFLRHIQFIGTAMGSPNEFKEVINFMETHKIKPLIHQEFPFEKATEALEILRLGKQMGKIVLHISK